MEQSARYQEPHASEQPTGAQPYSDDFMMYVFKVEMCKRVDKHNREQCAYAHPGELARRRHPSLYQALPCPETRAKKICPRLENCNCSHSTFEFWLHPDRYKTSLCERGVDCNRPICFFAHSEDELRPLPQGLQRTQPAHRAAMGSSAGAGSSRAASSSRQQQYGPQAPADNLPRVIAAASQAQGDIQVAAEHAVVGQVQQPSYVSVVQQAPVVPYVGVIPGQQQQQLLQQSVLGTGVVVGPSYMLMHPVDSSGSQIGGQQQAPEPASEQNIVPGQHVPGQHVPGLGLVRQPQPQIQYGSSLAQPPGAAVQVPQQPYVQSQRAAEPLYQRPPVGQVVMGYHPVQGYSGPQGVVMVQPGLQRGGTVAVIPAGPSMWPQVSAGMSAETGEAPSLEDLCAALAQLAGPPPDGPNTQLIMQHYPNQGSRQPQEMMPRGQQQAQQWGMQLQHQQQQPSYTQPASVQTARQLARRAAEDDPKDF